MASEIIGIIIVALAVLAAWRTFRRGAPCECGCARKDGPCHCGCCGGAKQQETVDGNR